MPRRSGRFERTSEDQAGRGPRARRPIKTPGAGIRPGAARDFQFREYADLDTASSAPTSTNRHPSPGASEPIIHKLNQAAFATADTPPVQERLNVLAAPGSANIRG